MIKNFLGQIRNSYLVKKYVEPVVAELVENNLSYNKTITGNFKDSFGNTFQLTSGLRNKIKPGWQAMFDQSKCNRVPSAFEYKIELVSAKKHVKNLKNMCNSVGITLESKSILEIGCYNGIKTHLLGLESCDSVTGSDVTFYYEKQITGNVNAVDSHLTKLHQASFNVFNDEEKKKIDLKRTFIEDDIINSTLANSSFDIICSWETLEHITNIDSAFQNMYRILKPGGITFHEYNPFFSLNGGHSLCTLDFPWGHCRLSENDFLRYIKEIRPSEYDLASSFYLNSLNRMSIHDLKLASAKAGFKILSLIPFVKKAHLSVYSIDSLENTIQHYPTVEQLDLICPVVWIVQQKL